MFRKSWMLGVVSLFGTVLWFALLAERPLFDPDEGRYAEIPREMSSGGDWVIPHLNALVYLEKPPLQYWLTALAFRGLGENEFAARLCPGIAGYLSLAAVFFLGRKLWGIEAGVRALLLTSASVLFVLLGHQLTLDMLLSFFLLAALGCFLMAQARRDSLEARRLWMLGCWAAMALAVLTKGLIGVLIPAATLSAYVVWQRDWILLRRLNLRWGLPLFTAIAAPWFVLAARANPQFLKFFFVREHFQRFLTPIEHRTQPWWFFVPVLVVAILPWLPQATRVLIAPFTDCAPRGQFDVARLLWSWCVFVLIFFSCSDAKLIPYILPAVPALALLSANPKTGQGSGSLLAGALLSLAFCVALLVYASGRWSSLEARDLLLQIRPMIFCMCILLTVGALISALCVLRGRPLAALASLCVSWFLVSGTILVAGNAAQTRFSAKDVARTLRLQAGAAGVERVPIFAVQSYQQSLVFYLGDYPELHRSEHDRVRCKRQAGFLIFIFIVGVFYANKTLFASIPLAAEGSPSSHIIDKAPSASIAIKDVSHDKGGIASAEGSARFPLRRERRHLLKLHFDRFAYVRLTNNEIVGLSEFIRRFHREAHRRGENHDMGFFDYCGRSADVFNVEPTINFLWGNREYKNFPRWHLNHDISNAQFWAMISHKLDTRDFSLSFKNFVLLSHKRCLLSGRLIRASNKITSDLPQTLGIAGHETCETGSYQGKEGGEKQEQSIGLGGGSSYHAGNPKIRFREWTGAVFILGLGLLIAGFYLCDFSHWYRVACGVAVFFLSYCCFWIVVMGAPFWI